MKEKIKNRLCLFEWKWLNKMLQKWSNEETYKDLNRAITMSKHYEKQLKNFEITINSLIRDNEEEIKIIVREKNKVKTKSLTAENEYLEKKIARMDAAIRELRLELSQQIRHLLKI